MISWILLLINLTSCFCGVFERQNMALRYEVKENSSITVEWRFSSKTNISIASLKIHCVQPELKVFYHLDNGVEESQHEQFAGRVQCDKEALRAGRVRLRLSGVRTGDSGLYLCRMVTELGKRVRVFSLSVTAAVDEPKPEKPKPKPASRGRVGLYLALGLALGLAAAAAALSSLCRCASADTALDST